MPCKASFLCGQKYAIPFKITNFAAIIRKV